MFQSTVGRSALSNDEEICHLKIFLNGAARKSGQGLVYSGSIFSAAESTLGRKFGRPHFIIFEQLSRKQSYPSLKCQDSKSLIEFADILSKFVGVRKQFGYSNDVFSLNYLEMVTGTLRLDMRRKWLGNIEKLQKRAQPPSLVDLNNWLQQQTIVHDQLLSSKKTSKYDPGKSHGVSLKRGSKNCSSDFEAVVIDKKTTNQCPLKDGVHSIWQNEPSSRSPLLITIRL